MLSGSTVEHAAVLINASPASEEDRINTGAVMHKSWIVRDGTVVNLLENAISTLTAMADDIKNWWDSPALQNV